MLVIGSGYKLFGNYRIIANITEEHGNIYWKQYSLRTFSKHLRNSRKKKKKKKKLVENKRTLPRPSRELANRYNCDTETVHDKTYNKTCVTSKDFDQPVHPPSMARVLCNPSLDNPVAVESCRRHMRSAKTQIRLRGCAGWSESSLVA